MFCIDYSLILEKVNDSLCSIPILKCNFAIGFDLVFEPLDTHRFVDNSYGNVCF